MNQREVELMEQIGQIIERLQEIQGAIAGTRQPPSQFELQTLQELGTRYAQLYAELQDWYDGKANNGAANDRTR